MSKSESTTPLSLTAAEITRIREKLGLTIQQAGEIIGGGPRAFWKYEMDKVTPSQGLINLLVILDAVPGLVKVLKGDTLTFSDAEQVSTDVAQYVQSHAASA